MKLIKPDFKKVALYGAVLALSLNGMAYAWVQINLGLDHFATNRVMARNLISKEKITKEVPVIVEAKSDKQIEATVEKLMSQSK